MELPPRARRIHAAIAARVETGGTTSACAENTLPLSPTLGHAGNYLRVRGEYSCNTTIILPHGELPPRARRIPQLRGCSRTCDGTTSACAENTYDNQGQRINAGNYLRVRGEYLTKLSIELAKWELPPRTRRILASRIRLLPTHGTTSACAENTLCLSRKPTFLRNYLRVRGEYVGLSQPNIQ